MAVMEDGPITYKNRVGPLFYWFARIGMIPYYNVFQKTTYRPLKRITSSTSSAESKEHVIEWCRRKTNEANYVQVAGAVLFASVASSLSWDSTIKSHWLGPASFYACILLSLASIFTAAQQTIILPDKDTSDVYDAGQIEALRLSLSNPNDDEPALVTLFAWQCPIMFMGYSVVFFLIGLCTVVVSPLAYQPAWDSSAKTVILFFVVVIFIASTAAITTSKVHKFRV